MDIHQEILDFIGARNNFLITAHLSADGDAYGAALAMAYLVEKMGKHYQVVFHDQEKDAKYAFLRGYDDILSYRPELKGAYEAAIVVDVPSLGRIGDPAALLPAREHCLKIDHHPIEEDFAALNMVDVDASSTCQMVYDIIVHSGIPLSEEVATLLFSGIMYDTGRFSFSNTNARDFKAAAHLLEYGVKPNRVANHLFFSNTFESLKVIGYGLSNMERFLDGRVVVISLSGDIMAENSRLDVDDLANYSLAMQGVEVGLFIREAGPQLTKVSFRSRGRVDVNRIARRFGGGGHIHAAGCRSTLGATQLKEQIVLAIAEALA